MSFLSNETYYQKGVSQFLINWVFFICETLLYSCRWCIAVHYEIRVLLWPRLTIRDWSLSMAGVGVEENTVGV